MFIIFLITFLKKVFGRVKNDESIPPGDQEKLLNYPLCKQDSYR